MGRRRRAVVEEVDCPDVGQKTADVGGDYPGFIVWVVCAEVVDGGDDFARFGAGEYVVAAPDLGG